MGGAFAMGTMSVGGGYAAAGVILDYDVTVAGAYAEGDMMLRSAFVVDGVTAGGTFAVGYAFTVGAAFTMASVLVRDAFAVGNLILRGAFAVGGMAMGSEVVVGGGMIVAVDYDVAQELARCRRLPAAPRASASRMGCVPAVTISGVRLRTPIDQPPVLSET